MEEELRMHVRSEIDNKTGISEDFDYLITRSQNTGMKRYLSSIGVDVQALLSRDPVYAQAGEIAAAKVVAEKLRQDEEKMALASYNAGFTSTRSQSTRLGNTGSMILTPRSPGTSSRPLPSRGATPYTSPRGFDPSDTSRF